MAPEAREVALLLYGLGGVRALMLPLERTLRRSGYAAETWRYNSFRHDLNTHVDQLCKYLAQLDEDPSITRINCVGHSMGAIIVRAALSRRIPTKLGRVVFMAPPHKGSFVASALAPRLGRIFRFLPQLTTLPDSFVNQLGDLPGVDFGVIAASHDHLVKTEATMLPSQRDHHVLRSIHFVIMHPDAGRLVANFLKHGRFQIDVKPS